jgi:predicted branched-subunit amino acid permease
VATFHLEEKRVPAMHHATLAPPTRRDHPRHQRARDFWLFLGGETISNLGTSFTLFALPLLVFRLTGSALNLALSTVAETLPYLCFGLLIGAWVDRMDRKRLMIVVDLLQALVLASIPALYALGILSVWWIYGAGFVGATLKIGFESSQFAAVPSLVGQQDLVAANSRLQASFSAAQMLGPVLAGGLLFILPLPMLLFPDAASFLLSACALFLIRTSFNAAPPRERHSVRQDVMEGLRYVFSHPVLRAISLMTPLMNLLTTTTTAQLVLLAVVTYRAGSAQVGLLSAASSLGIILFSGLAGPLRKLWPFSKVALFALLLMGSLIFALGVTPWYWLAVPLWGLSQGAEMLFNVSARSLRQAMVPDYLLGRVISVSIVLAYSSVPLGALFGGILLQQVGASHVAQMYAAVGLLIVLVALGFARTALGHAERYLPKGAVASPRPRSPSFQPAFREFLTGMRATVPLAIGLIPYMVIYGVTAVGAGMSPLAVQVMSLVVFSGAQLPAVVALRAGTPVVLVGVMVAVMNLRHLFYSAKLAPHLRQYRLPWRLVASYFLVDESFAVTHQRTEGLKRGKPRYWVWFLIGAGLTIWLVVNGVTTLSIVFGPEIPLGESLAFIPTLAFLSLTVWSLKGPASGIAALSAGAAAVLLAGLPLNLGLLAAVAIGATTGLATHLLLGKRELAPSKEGA